MHRIAVLVLGVLISATLVAQARWFELYDGAIKDIQAANYRVAEEKLQQARKLNPRSGRNVLRYGSWRDDYFPEYYLGYIMLVTDRPDEAVKYFLAARQAQINISDAEFRQMPDFEARARKTVADRATPPIATPPPKPLAKEESPIGAPLPPTESRPVDARDLRADVGALLDTSRGHVSRNDLDAAERAANDALALATKENLSDLRPAAQALLSDIASRRRLAASVQTALKDRNADQARRTLDALTAAHPDYPAVSLRTAVSDLERAVRLEGLYRRVLTSFFAGRHQDALQTLNNIERETPLNSRGHFYRAASLAALAATSPKAEEDPRLQQALSSYKRAAAGRSEFQRDLRYISPKVRDLLGIPNR
jgi:hypothetical protein